MAVVCGLMLVAPAGAADGYEYHVHGDPGDVERSTIGRLVLIGGGRDAGFRWMIGGPGGGDFVVIRASGGADYNGYARGLGAVDSLETLAIRDRRLGHLRRGQGGRRRGDLLRG
jgi:hypothetical protein